MSKFVNRVGETNIMKCGLLAEIIHYNNARDITVKFSDGNIRVGVPYDSFKKGILKSTTNRRKNLEVGDKYVSNSGFKYEVVKKLSNNRAVVRFEDGIEHDYCISSVKSGSIAHPSQSRFKRDKSLYIGETYRHTSGELMTIIGYRSSTDIDIRFEDGTIVHNKSYGSFRRGEISKFDKPYRERVIGEKLRAKNGLMMEIIACRSSIDIDIRFEDGVVVKGKRYNSFKNGEIKHPKYLVTRDRTGESVYSKSGLKMTIVGYRNNKDIDVLYSDGTEMKSVNYNTFITGSLGHEGLRCYKGHVEKGKLFNNFQVYKFAYRLEDPKDVYYICECQKCKHRDILTPTEMLEHKCDIAK